MRKKLILFDIDGTLLNAHQVPRIVMRRVFLSRFNDFDYHDDYSFTGKTDWKIVEHLLEYAKVDIAITEILVHDILKEFGVELEKEMIGATKFFSRFYGDPTKNNKIKIIVDDARNYLRVTNKKYDLIISEPSNIWVSGVASNQVPSFLQTILDGTPPALCFTMED